MKNVFITILLCISIFSCKQQEIEMVTSTEAESWLAVNNAAIVSQVESPDVIINLASPLQTIDGFGTCFNELGWTSLSFLTDADREAILKELFEPDSGANFTICRMPIGANDFSRDWYSYDETDGDFAMDNFSISNDLETLVPFIKSAQKYNPSLKIWASPWSPPTWMKYNKHYAARSVLGEVTFKSDEWGMDLTGINNGLAPEKEGKRVQICLSRKRNTPGLCLVFHQIYSGIPGTKH